MDLNTLTTFFAWCSAINGGLLVIWGLFIMAMPDLVYRTQSAFFPGSREAHGVTLYAFLGAFKMLWIVFNLVPYLVLRMVL